MVVFTKSFPDENKNVKFYTHLGLVVLISPGLATTWHEPSQWFKPFDHAPEFPFRNWTEESVESCDIDNEYLYVNVVHPEHGDYSYRFRQLGEAEHMF